VPSATCRSYRRRTLVHAASPPPEIPLKPVPPKPKSAPLSPKESLARGCLLVIVWLLILVVAAVFTLSRAHFPPVGGARPDAGPKAPRPPPDAGPASH
jgi:hypothetical protein